jgi:signal transduction histidine kinase
MRELVGSVTRWQLAIITGTVAGIVALRLLFDPFSLQGLIFVLVNGAVAWQWGSRAALISTALGFVAVHIQFLIQYPILLQAPGQLLRREYFAGFGLYLGLSFALIFLGQRYYRVVGQLRSERRNKEQSDRRHKRDLEESLSREMAARQDAEEANRLKDEFLATLSHELRTPLNAILGYARILRTGALGNERQAKGFEVVERNATMLARLVGDLLDVSRIVSGKTRLNMQAVDLIPVIEQAVATIQPTAEAKGVQLQLSLDVGATSISGDPDRLQQVVWNLLANAVKFTPSRGQVAIQLVWSTSHAEIVISDNGRGITPEFLPHVFDRFRQADGGTTREHSGLGLGLAICRDLVELHGGSIHAASEGVARGATFRIALPLRIGPAERPMPEPLRLKESYRESSIPY